MPSFDIVEELKKTIEEYQEAKLMVREATSRLDQLAYDCRNMTVKEALSHNLIRFNFPSNRHMRQAIIEND